MDNVQNCENYINIPSLQTYTTLVDLFINGKSLHERTKLSLGIE
jgi:hypothetical protein